MSFTMMPIWDYLSEKAKFYSPPISGNQGSSNSVNDTERYRTPKDKRPQGACLDDQMVDTLINNLREFLEGKTITASQQSDLDQEFQPIVDRNGKLMVWEKNECEEDAANLIVVGARQALRTTMEVLGLVLRSKNQYSPPDCQSKVDYRFSTTNDRGILVEVKAPKILDLITPFLQRTYNKLTYETTGVLIDRVLSKLYVYMYLSGAYWSIVTSHHKWTFVRRLENPVALVYSTVELQENNTRPFLALLAMILAAEGVITIPRPTEELLALSDIEQSQASAEHSGDSSFSSDNFSEYTSNVQPSTTEYPNTRGRQRGGGAAGGNNLQIRWSPQVIPNGEILVFRTVLEMEQNLPLGSRPVRRLQLHCLLGCGSTGAVYGATLDVHELELTDKNDVALTYAIKMVQKRASSKRKGQLDRLRNEFEIYKKIERARKAGLIGGTIPRCYGLYESDTTLALLLEYGGRQVGSWEEVSQKDRQDLYGSVELLHRIGVCHCDISPQNVVKGKDGVYKLIDFSLSAMHKCPERYSVAKRSIHGKSRERCVELDVTRELLLHQVVAH